MALNDLTSVPGTGLTNTCKVQSIAPAVATNVWNIDKSSLSLPAAANASRTDDLQLSATGGRSKSRPAHARPAGGPPGFAHARFGRKQGETLLSSGDRVAIERLSLSLSL